MTEDHAANIRLMEDPETVLPQVLFQPPGTFSLSDRAWSEARDFADRLRMAEAHADYVVDFNWVTLTRWQDKQTGQWKSLGPALCIGGLPRRKVPRQIICTLRGLEYVAVVGEAVMKQHPGRVIEFSGERGRFMLV